MARLLAYLFADHHSGGGYPTRGIDDSQYSMAQIVARALEDRPEWVISLGDAVNKAQTYADAVVPLTVQLRRLTGAGIRVGFIDGNHDKRGLSWLSGEFTHLDGEVVRLGGHRWMGVDFRTRDGLARRWADLPGDVGGLFMHQCWGDFVRFEGVAQGDFADVPSPVRMLATGDFHGECVIRTFAGKDGQEVTVCNPGSTSMQEIREPADKFFVALYDDDDRPFVKVPLRTRRVVRPSVVHSQGELGRLLGEVGVLVDDARAQAEAWGLPEAVCRPLLHVTHSSTLADLPRRLEKVVGGGAHLFYSEVRPEEEGRPTAAPVAADGEALTPLALLAREMAAGESERPLDRDAYALAQLLYHEKDRASITRKVKEWVEEQTRET
jgi:hypothetical protein